MWVSKKKFNQMVEEEVHKRMNAADERRWQQEKHYELMKRIEEVDARSRVTKADLDVLDKEVRSHIYGQHQHQDPCIDDRYSELKAAIRRLDSVDYPPFNRDLN